MKTLRQRRRAAKRHRAVLPKRPSMAEFIKAATDELTARIEGKRT